eukprot:INCI1175.1.p1 GENE.INCI1175.1~~INCI1175.1.p1  ORF type:complete len:298 (+),score=33.74 INCI1175.1:257-1150(+)
MTSSQRKICCTFENLKTSPYYCSTPVLVSTRRTTAESARSDPLARFDSLTQLGVAIRMSLLQATRAVSGDVPLLAQQLCTPGAGQVKPSAPWLAASAAFAKPSSSVLDGSTPDSILAFAHGPRSEGIMAQRRSKAVDLLANLTRSSLAAFNPPPPPSANVNSTPVTNRKRKVTAMGSPASSALATSNPRGPVVKRSGSIHRSSSVATAALSKISGHEMFHNCRKASKEIFGLDLADHFKDVELPYCAQRDCVLIPTETRMRREGRPCGSAAAARLWIAVAKDSKRGLVARPALLMGR